MLNGASIPTPHLPSSHVAAQDVIDGLLAVLGAIGAAGVGLFGCPAREGLPTAVHEPARWLVRHVRYLHSGQIGDYIAWWSAGASVLGGVCLIALR